MPPRPAPRSRRKVARPLGLGATAAAEGIVRIIDVKMEEAIKAISTMRGHDLRDFMLLAFGGAGPVHAGRLARDLGMAGVIVPLYPGVFSAIGLLMSDVAHDYIRSRLTPLSDVAPADVNGMLDRLAAQARDELDGDGFAPAHIRIERALDLRYAGQGYEIAVPCPARALAAADLTALRDGIRPAAPARCSDTWRRRSRSRSSPTACAASAWCRRSRCRNSTPTGGTLADAMRGRRPVRFDGVEVDCPVYQRERLDVGLSLTGPAILDQLDCTTVIYPGQTARVDEWKNLIVTM